MAKLLLRGEGVRVDVAALGEKSLYLHPSSCGDQYKQLVEMCFSGNTPAPMVTAFVRSINMTTHVSTLPTRDQVERNLQLTRSGEWIDVIHGVVGLATINPSDFSSLVLLPSGSAIDVGLSQQIEDGTSRGQLLASIKELDIHEREPLLPHLLVSLGETPFTKESGRVVRRIFANTEYKNTQVAALSTLIKWKGKGDLDLTHLALTLLADRDYGPVDGAYLTLIRRLKFAEITTELSDALLGLLEHSDEKVRTSAGQTISELSRWGTKS